MLPFLSLVQYISRQLQSLITLNCTCNSQAQAQYKLQQPSCFGTRSFVVVVPPLARKKETVLFNAFRSYYMYCMAVSGIVVPVVVSPLSWKRAYMRISRSLFRLHVIWRSFFFFFSSLCFQCFTILLFTTTHVLHCSYQNAELQIKLFLFPLLLWHILIALNNFPSINLISTIVLLFQMLSHLSDISAMFFFSFLFFLYFSYVPLINRVSLDNFAT